MHLPPTKTISYTATEVLHHLRKSTLIQNIIQHNIATKVTLLSKNVLFRFSFSLIFFDLGSAHALYLTFNSVSLLSPSVDRTSPLPSASHGIEYLEESRLVVLQNIPHSGIPQHVIMFRPNFFSKNTS